MGKEYQTIVWEKDNSGTKTSDQRYSGESLEFALALAGQLFSLKLLEAECRKEGKLTLRYNLEPSEEYLGNIKNFYITVAEAPKQTGTKEIFKPLFEFGDKTVGTFTRFARA